MMDKIEALESAHRANDTHTSRCPSNPSLSTVAPSVPPNGGSLLHSVEPSIHNRMAVEERTTMTTTVNPRRKAAKAVKAPPVLRRTFATHQELLDDMKAFGQRLVETPGAAREFLISAGLLTKSGKPKQLIRD